MNLYIERRGLLLVISAPSGGGKSVVTRRLREFQPELEYSVSVTSRPPRGDERDGIDYRFVTRQQFEQMIEQHGFYEWAEVHGNLYGTLADTVDQALAAGRDVVMDIDVQGARRVKQRCPDAVTVFLAPPSMKELEHRLRDRATDSDQQVRLRLRNARREMADARHYDYLVVNHVLEKTVQTLGHILQAERQRTFRLKIRPEKGE